ncbi:hypothetical protein FIBSPDRAFT_810538 [Athelia psychrophila]|uniref:MYND-type domain-containing protein n=1 Tax=Athelia psychrophila TaxID=1759441 RepID=A0A166WRI8_9AGAM|nr:hypothetical protein FIBSPDRAFT_810538 [Fibularhizoctonia sp. CBS 109695]
MLDRKCEKCMEPATRRCSGCKDRKAWYCSERCQRKYWPIHIFDCNPTKPINSAYQIAQAVHLARTPFDLQAQQDYGFYNAKSAEDKRMLLCLYEILLVGFEVESKVLHSWRTRDNLAERIKAIFQAVPGATRLLPFLWFLEHQSLLEPLSIIGPELSRPSVLPWRYLVDDISADPTDAEINAVRSGWPEDKKQCYELFGLNLSQFNPIPELPSWMYFGFCTCRVAEESARLGRIYRVMIENCKFDEILAAFRASSLSTLMDECGLRAMRESLPHLQEVLSCTGSTPKKFKSVWWLKLYVLVGDNEIPKSIPAVAIIAYGFANCLDQPREQEDLKEVYRRFFESEKGDPIALHDAAMAGRTFDYVGGVIKLKKKFRRLMTLNHPHVLDSLR